MKKIIFAALFCLILLSSKAQIHKQSQVPSLKEPSTAIDTSETSDTRTYFRLIHNNEGYGYTVFKKSVSNTPQSDFDCYAVLWNRENNIRNRAGINQFVNDSSNPENSFRFYNARNEERGGSGGETANYTTFFNTISNPSVLNVPFSLFNSNNTISGGSLALTPDNASFGFTTTGNASSAITLNNTQMSVTDGVNNKGLTYGADYSTAGITDPLWIPTWGAVKNLVSTGGGAYPTGGIANLFNNGLAPNTDANGNSFIGLGGTLNQSTAIDINANQFTLNDIPASDYGILNYSGGTLAMGSPGTSGSGSNYYMYDGNIQLSAYSTTSTDLMDFNVGASSTFLTDFTGLGNLYDNSALLNLSSIKKGFLPPVMTTIQKNAIVSPAEGLIVYDQTLHAVSYFNGTVWQTAVTPDNNGNIVTANKITTASGQEVFKTPNGSWKYIHVDDDGSRLIGSATVTTDASGNTTVTIP